MIQANTEHSIDDKLAQLESNLKFTLLERNLFLNITVGSWSEWSPCSVKCGSGSQRREFRCSVCQNAWIQKTRGCFTSCINHSITNQGMLRRGKNNMALNNNSIREALVSSEIQCAHYCLRSPECRSINVGKEEVLEHSVCPAKVHASITCQLNHATAYSKPGYLVYKYGFNYYDLLSKDLE